MGVPAVADEKMQVLEQVIAHGDLSKLSPAQRLQYYKMVCESLGLNPFTRPFEYLVLNNRLTLYARKDATDQLRKIHGISIRITQREQMGDLYLVQAQATDKEGRTDEAIGVVSIAGLKGDALANALMKAETKAKRRATLSIAGLGWLDETEVETIEGATVVRQDEAARPEAVGPEAHAEPEPPKAPKPKQNGGGAMKALFGAVDEWAKKTGFDPEQAKEDVKAMLRAKYGVSSCSELTAEQWTEAARDRMLLVKALEQRYISEARRQAS